MTENELRQQIVNAAKSYIGTVEGGAKHKEILSIYNNHKPLARGYTMKVKDAWCDCFASAMAIKCGMTDIIPTEVGCGKHIELFQKIGRWVENDAYTPKPADYIFYDWEDDGKGDNKGGADHVGIVEKVENGKITVIEGNKSDSVSRRVISVNGKCIRGFGVPDYASKATAPEHKQPSRFDNIAMPELGIGMECAEVMVLQRLLRDMNYRGLNGSILEANGVFDANTERAVKKYQEHHGLVVDGICGIKTWNKMLKGVKL